LKYNLSATQTIDHINHVGGDERRITMMPNNYIQERFAQAHHRDLLREAEHEPLLAQLPPSGQNMPLPSRLFFLWRALRTSLQKRLQRHID
jgi:hypothetical protein